MSDTTLGDGAMGTMLQAAGLPLGAAPERWNLERPEAVTWVHAAHAAAGAQWATTNTFGANGLRLALSGLGTRVEEVNRAAVQCARAGAPGLTVLGSMGPTGTARVQSWEKAYREQAEALAGACVDGFMVETIVLPAEGAAAVRAAVATGAGPVFAAFTPGDDGCLLDGTSPETAAEALFRAGAFAVGLNCGSGPESLLEGVRRLVRADLGPVLAAPNAGLPLIEAGRAVYSLSPDAFARSAIQLEGLGARFLAGCCGTSPEHVAAAARALNRSSHGD
jgi:5-methyltetrahydrofolate--homocysteine methyltransferase